MINRVGLLLVAMLSLMLGATAAARAAPLRVLYLTQSAGFEHEPVKRGGADKAPSELAMIAIGQESGAFTAEVNQNASIITPERLKSIDVLVFYTTGVLPIPGATWTAVQDWVRSGKGGFVGLHSATDTAWPFEGRGESYTRFIGGKFAGHPWTQGTPIRLVSHDPDHPTTAMWGAATDFAEEIYQYSDFDPARVRVLQSLDFTAMPLKRPYPVPVTWVRQMGKGRLFYTNLGHTPSTWDDPRYRAQIVAAIEWVGHRRDGVATPDPRRQALWAIRTLLAYGNMPESEKDQILQRLSSADEQWLLATAARIGALRQGFPAKPTDTRAAFEASYAKLVADVRAKAATR